MREPTEDEVLSLRYRQLSDKSAALNVAIVVLQRERDAIHDELAELEEKLDKEIPF